MFDFAAKGTTLHESTSFNPFCVKIGWGLDPQEAGKKIMTKTVYFTHSPAAPVDLIASKFCLGRTTWT